MNLKTIGTLIKKRWFSILFYSIIFLLIFSPAAKSWLLQQVVSTGLFNAEIKKDDTEKLSDAATFSFTDINGKVATTAGLKSKVVFINFWASWCPPCRAEMPSIENLYQKLKDNSNFVFLFINEDGDRNKGVNYLQKNNFTIPFYQASTDVPPEIFNGSLPTTVVLNKEGKVVLKHSGMGRYDTEDFIRQLKELE
ncbi:MAG TPA: TlpA disulfide reductase family protein [Hanamia sp.]|nr:TlpA disulfide reductase family protein [Hanamia sp.]